MAEGFRGVQDLLDGLAGGLESSGDLSFGLAIEELLDDMAVFGLHRDTGVGDLGGQLGNTVAVLSGLVGEVEVLAGLLFVGVGRY